MIRLLPLLLLASCAIDGNNTPELPDGLIGCGEIHLEGYLTDSEADFCVCRPPEGSTVVTLDTKTCTMETRRI